MANHCSLPKAAALHFPPMTLSDFPEHFYIKQAGAGSPSFVAGRSWTLTAKPLWSSMTFTQLCARTWTQPTLCLAEQQEGAELPLANVCAYALALISLLIEPLNVLFLPDPCRCFSFLPFSECLFIVTWNKWKKNSYKLLVPWKMQGIVSLLRL